MSLVSQAAHQTPSRRGASGLSNITQQPNQFIARHDGGIRPFSIIDLAPPNQRHQPVYQPPTPPPDDDDNEAMDWTPSQETKFLRPATSYRTLHAVPQQSQPISYREKLPADGLSQSVGVRNPSTQPVFGRGSERHLAHLKTPKKYAIRDSSDESPFATPYEPSVASGSADLSPIKFAQPRFFPHSEREDLGLESLMANNFSLAEEPHEVRAHQQWGTRDNGTQPNSKDVNAQWHGPAGLFLLAVSCAVWISTPLLPSLTASQIHLRLAALCIAALVILKSLLLAFRKKSGRSIGDTPLLAFEFITIILLGITLRHRAATTYLEKSIGPLETRGIFLMVELVGHEAWMLYFGTWARRKSNEDSQSPRVPPPATVPGKADRQQPFTGSSMSSSRHDPNVGIGTGFISQHLQSSSQRTTRARAKLENDTHAQGGFGSLSIGGSARNERAMGMRSLNLGQPQSRNRNGMW